jgi:putative addiction module component (TIGR02574 family)
VDEEPTDTQEEIEAAWAAEIRRRIADIDSGKTKLLSWKDFQRIFDEA